MAQWLIELNEGAERVLDALTDGGDVIAKTDYLNSAIEKLLGKEADDGIKNSKDILVEKINSARSLRDLRLIAKSILGG